MEIQFEWQDLTKTQQDMLQQALSETGVSIQTIEIHKQRQADELVLYGLLQLDTDTRMRIRDYYITAVGRAFVRRSKVDGTVLREG